MWWWWRSTTRHAHALEAEVAHKGTIDDEKLERRGVLLWVESGQRRRKALLISLVDEVKGPGLTRSETFNAFKIRFMASPPLPTLPALHRLIYPKPPWIQPTADWV